MGYTMLGYSGEIPPMSLAASVLDIPKIHYRTADLLSPAFATEIEGFEVSDWQPYSSPRGKRLSAPSVDGLAEFGFTDIVEVGDGLHAIITDWPAASCRSRAAWAEKVPAQQGWLYIALEGDGRLEIEGLGRARRAGPSCSITIAPPDATFVWHMAPGVARRGVCIPFHARYLLHRFPDLLERCAGSLGPWLSNTETQMRDFEIPLAPIMTAATSALLTSRLLGQSRHTFVSATADQLLCLALASLPHSVPQDAYLSTRDRQIIHLVRARIDQDLSDPARLEDLAKEYGINRTKLRQGFKDIFGMSAADYLHDQRMRVAYDMLERECSVSEVAASIGYPHLSNFATAFKRRFGQSPRKISSCRRVC
jgi:AraC-like DNA-binding protein